MLDIGSRMPTPPVVRTPSIGRAVGTAVARAARRVTHRASSSHRSSSHRSYGNSGGSGRSFGRSAGSSGRRIGHSVSRSFGNSRSSGSRNSGRSAAVRHVTVPKPPSLAAYLSTDDVYQNTLRTGKKSLADFISELNRRRGEANTSFTQTQSSMEKDRVQQLQDLRDEFASRGLIQSGLYGQEQGKFQDQFTQQLNSLKQSQASLLADLLSQQTNYQRENAATLEAARQEALQRRAQRYRIGI